MTTHEVVVQKEKEIELQTEYIHALETNLARGLHIMGLLAEFKKAHEDLATMKDELKKMGGAA